MRKSMFKIISLIIINNKISLEKKKKKKKRESTFQLHFQGIKDFILNKV